MIALEITVRLHFESVAHLCWLLIYCIFTLRVIEKSVDRPGQGVAKPSNHGITTNMQRPTEILVNEVSYISDY